MVGGETVLGTATSRPSGISRSQRLWRRITKWRDRHALPTRGFTANRPWSLHL